MRKLNSKGFAHWILPVIVVLLIGAIGGYIYLRNSNASTTALGPAACKIRGRIYNSTNGVCTDNCHSGAGYYVTSSDATYNYCSAAISTGISGTDCNNLGRKAIGAGCTRHWNQTAGGNYGGALQCTGNTIDGGPYYYHATAGRDYCNASATQPTSGGSTGGGGTTTTPTGWVWPLPSSTHVGSGGYYLAPGSKGYHPGIDIGASGGGSLGAAVKAAHAGSVTQSYNGGSCGWFMVVKASGTNYWMGYQHLDPNKMHLGAGTAVSAGQTIGYVGKAGGTSCGTFYHVHFSLELQNDLTFWNTSKSYIESRTDAPCGVLPGC